MSSSGLRPSKNSARSQRKLDPLDGASNNLFVTTRRQFLATASLGSVAAAVGQVADNTPASPVAREQPLGEPLFRFLQINDTHYQSPQAEVISPTYRHANGRVHWVLDAIRSGKVFPALDFILHVGDMTHQTTVDRREELRIFKALLDSLPIPVYTVVGNHDNVQGEGVPELEAPYREVFGDKFNYSFVHQGIGFVAVDTSGTAMPKLPAAAVALRERKLRENLAALGERPIIVASHVPLLPVREMPVLEKSFGFPSSVVREPGVLEIVREHRGRIVAVLSGHLHISGTVWDAGVAHINVCGTASYPHDIALHTVHTQALETRLVRLPSDLLEPTTCIHGARRWGRDFTDAGHPDYTSYLMGTASERLVRVPLRRGLK